MTLIGFLCLVLPAQAGGTAYYHPDAVAARSARFADAAEAVGPGFEQAQETLARVSAGLEDLELAVALAGDAAPAELRSWASSARRRVTGQYLQVQKHVDLLTDDYQQVFEQAVERNLPAVAAGREVTVCADSGTLAMMRRTTCTGDDVNVALATALDADTTLAAEIADIGSVPWPSVGIETSAQPVIPLTGATRHAQLATVAEALIPGRIEVRRAALADAAEREESRILEGDREAMARGEAAKQAWRTQTAADGAALIEALRAALPRVEKAGGPADVGLCANPASLGGCPGEDVTDQLVLMLLADKKLVKAAAKIR